VSSSSFETLVERKKCHYVTYMIDENMKIADLLNGYPFLLDELV